MKDGWTDRYQARCYFAIRASVVYEWKFQIITIRIQPGDSHSANELSRFVKQVISEFFHNPAGNVLLNTTDNAANMLILT